MKPSSVSSFHTDPLEPAASTIADSNPPSRAGFAAYESEFHAEIEREKNIPHQIRDDDRKFGQSQFRDVIMIANPMQAAQSAATVNEQDRSISTCSVYHFKTFAERQGVDERPKNCRWKYALIDALEWLSSKSPNGYHQVLLQDVVYSQPPGQRNLFAQERMCDKPFLLDFDEMFLPRRQELHEGKTLLISGTWVTRRPSSTIEVWATVMPITLASRENIRCRHVTFSWSASIC